MPLIAPDVTAAKRLVIKIGSALLVDRMTGLKQGWLSALAMDVAEAKLRGTDVVLVSSGSIALGRKVLALGDGPLTLEQSQAAAAVGQIRLARAYEEVLQPHGITTGQVLVTLEDTEDRRRYLNSRATMETLLGLGVVPIVNENDTVATDEIRLGDNDRLAALVAHLVRADALVLLSDVDGLYDGPPGKGDAHLITEVHDMADLSDVSIGGVGSGVGLGGMATKVEAARIATAAGIPVVLAHAGSAREALAGHDTGTVFLPTGRRTPTRLLWLGHASTPQGRLHLDAGAARAVTVRRTSLLPAGVTQVEGEFTAGDPVDLLDENGHTIARGLVNYDSAELPGLLGRSTRDLARERGPEYEREVVHRDDIVVLSGAPRD
jgi:glutamate 5-kinase